MKFNKIAAAATAIILTIGSATAPMAQIAASGFTIENVTADNPFGEMPVDLTAIDVANIEGFLSTLTTEQRLELQQRCVVVAANAANYAPEAVAMCEAVVAAAQTPGM
jgi:hypothetical protein